MIQVIGPPAHLKVRVGLLYKGLKFTDQKLGSLVFRLKWTLLSSEHLTLQLKTLNICNLPGSVCQILQLFPPTKPEI